MTKMEISYMHTFNENFFETKLQIVQIIISAIMAKMKKKSKECKNYTCWLLGVLIVCQKRGIWGWGVPPV